MRVVLQRVSRASVTIGGAVRGSIERGYVALVGIAPTDTPEDGAWLAMKLVSLRLFPDDAGKMNLSINEVDGGILVISQFTLFGSVRKGTRPSFNGAAPPEQARALYDIFLTQISDALGRPVAAGEFGADMQVELVNDGPVTLIVDTGAKDEG